MMAAYRLPRPNLKNLEIRHNRIWTKADNVYSYFSMIKDPVTPRRTFDKHWIVTAIREEWEKNWTKQLRKGYF